MSHLATNAPVEWPNVDADAIDEHWAQSVVRVGAALTRGFEASSRFRLSGFLQTIILPKGILEIPIVIVEGSVTWPVFVYVRASAEDDAHFSAVGKLLRAEGNSSPVYFAPRPLSMTDADANPLRMLAPDLFERSKTPAIGDYAMWWATDDAPGFGESTALRCLDRLYHALDGYMTYMAGLFLKPLGLVQGDVARVRLPGKMLRLPVVGPGNLQLLLSVERERGVQMLFHIPSTRTTQRDRLLNLLAEYAEGLRQHAETRGWQVDETEDRQPTTWWKLAKAFNTAPERNLDPVKAVGLGRIG